MPETKTRPLFTHPKTPATDGWAGFDSLAETVREVAEMPSTGYAILRDVALGDSIAEFFLDRDRRMSAAVA